MAAGHRRARRAGTVLVALGIAAAATPVAASADSTEDYPIPSKMLHTTCTAEQYLAAVRDTNPVYYERYIIDKHNKPLDVQQGAIDRARWFFAMDYAGRRAYSEQRAVDIYSEPMSFRWSNWDKIFFNNKGVVAKATAVCDGYPPDDVSVWDGI
ncbi:DUF5078 domain-containing protein [Mycobacterium sp. MYCO198283]|uniref:DUF5078 domain-containing protein n=1 Tax=Mycobacterium sp. MYCO198283 TaxID=2883505 RepID=UPI001E398F2E|nr:DUF5078 domain-containing protein [Mycobacterium sp. MYCO198283]MCG5434009.1 DUF5078 domain-containing protein [Mycobacterium sp. MYCO198283]